MSVSLATVKSQTTDRCYLYVYTGSDVWLANQGITLKYGSCIWATKNYMSAVGGGYYYIYDIATEKNQLIREDSRNGNVDYVENASIVNSILSKCQKLSMWNRMAYNMVHRNGSKYSTRTTMPVTLCDEHGNATGPTIPVGGKVAIDSWQGYTRNDAGAYDNSEYFFRCDGYYDANGAFHETSGKFCPLCDTGHYVYHDPAHYVINTFQCKVI